MTPKLSPVSADPGSRAPASRTPASGREGSAFRFERFEAAAGAPTSGLPTAAFGNKLPSAAGGARKGASPRGGDGGDGEASPVATVGDERGGAAKRARPDEARRPADLDALQAAVLALGGLAQQLARPSIAAPRVGVVEGADAGAVEGAVGVTLAARRGAAFPGAAFPGAAFPGAAFPGAALTKRPTESEPAAAQEVAEAPGRPLELVSPPAAEESGFLLASVPSEPTVGRPNSLGAPAASPEPSEAAQLRWAALEDPSLRVELSAQAARLVVSLGEDGPVALHLRVRDQIADVTVTGPARELLTAEAPRLATALAEQGLSLGSFSLGGRSDRDGGRQQREENEEDEPKTVEPIVSRRPGVVAPRTPTRGHGLSVKA